jgi:hypothetical protein
MFPYFASNNGKLIGISAVNHFYVLQNRCPTADGTAVLNQLGETAADPFRLRSLYGAR